MDSAELKVISELSSKLSRLIRLAQKHDLRGLSDTEILTKMNEEFSHLVALRESEDMEC